MFWFIVFLCVALVIGVNLFFSFSWQTLIELAYCFACIFVPSALWAVIIRILPKKWFTPNNKLFHVFKFENKLYEKVGVKNWKDKIPELGKTSNFKRDKLYDSRNPEYMSKYINESCYAESIHVVAVLLAFLSFILMPDDLILRIGLPTAICYLILSMPSIIIQRYMRPRLLKMYKRLKTQIDTVNKIEEQETVQQN